jgi:hypothetical protein
MEPPPQGGGLFVPYALIAPREFPGSRRNDRAGKELAQVPANKRRYLMQRTIIATAAAAALALGTFAVPQKAEAHAWWWLPAAVVGGVVVGGAIANSHVYAAPRGSVYVQPTNCRIVRERIGTNRYREVEVCR